MTVQANPGEVGLAEHGGDEVEEDVVGEALDDRVERRPDDHADREVHDVAAKRELLELVEQSDAWDVGHDLVHAGRGSPRRTPRTHAPVEGR
ncbi:hypothetical protein [Euzebya pacifica]|uniref:hypothetical protein n=1 Tax=Euzebya pacifica TaxID=1608957 RepID=UPI001FE52602|nr:hypothetical protein [Euzebya pacifica]